MSGTMLTVTGGNDTKPGIVGVPSNYSQGVSSILQAYLNGLPLPTAADLSGGGGDVVVPSGGGVEYTDVSTVNGSGTGAVSGAFTVASGAGVVQAQGDMTLSGNGQTSVAVLGANSNVVYSDVNGGSSGGADSIFAAGGNDSITLYSTTNSGSSYQITSTGNDTLNLQNAGTGSRLRHRRHGHGLCFPGRCDGDGVGHV